MAGDYRLDGLATPVILDQLHDLLTQVRADHPDVAAGDLMLFETAVIEIAGNVVEHGQPPGQVPYSFTLDVAPSQVTGVLSHVGAPIEGALGRAMPGDEAEDGRGLPLAELALDDLVYRHEAGVNRWLLTRERRALDTS